MTNHFQPASLLAAVAGICFHLTMNTAIAAERTLFDFSTVTNATAWQIVNDDVMGGVSSGRFSVTNGVAVFRGELSLENKRWHWPILQTFCSESQLRRPSATYGFLDVNSETIDSGIFGQPGPAARTEEELRRLVQRGAAWQLMFE